MSGATERKLPPVIRVFLSSTFADMDHERSYFNEVLVPKLNRICAERGVSFFSVDLRWGITEEQQLSGHVLPICLGEIDRCRPYFIGILGNRYGTVMDTVPESIATSIPWLRGKEGKSITELEMLYAVLDFEQQTPSVHSSFYFRDSALTERWYGASDEDPHISALKECIVGNENVTHSSYRSVEEFGELVMRDILSWCDKEFPVPEKASEVRREWYNSELLRNYVTIGESHDFLDEYIRQSRRSLLLHGTGERGKTTLLSAWQPAEASKILINCGSDDTFRYWPMTVMTLIRELMALSGERIMPSSRLTRAMFNGMGSSSGDNNLYFSTNGELEEFRMAFLEWVSGLETKKPVYVVINDLNLDDDERTVMLSWIPVETRGGVRFICSTNNVETVEFAEIVGWNCKEMPPFTREHAALYLRSYLNIFGKSLSDEQTELLLGSPVSRHAGHLRSVADFLINHGRFHNLDGFISDIASFSEHTALYPYLLNYLIGEAEEGAAEVTDIVLALLLETPVSLTEQECYALTSRFVDVTPLEWAAATSILEQLRVNKGDYWNLTGHGLRAAVSARIAPEARGGILEALADRFAEKVESAEGDDVTGGSKRYLASCAKAALTLYARGGKNEKLLGALKSRGIMNALCFMEKPALRAAWLHLILESDIDVAQELYGVFESALCEYGKEHTLTCVLSEFFVDLELNGYVAKVEKMMGKQILGGIHADFELLSPDFNKFLRALLAKLDEMDSRSAIRLIAQILEKYPELPAIEICHLLRLKAQYESNIDAKNDLLVTINSYFEMALRSGNLYEFVRAMDMRAHVLHNVVERDEEALRLLEKLCPLYLSRGEVRGYLAALNSKGNVLGTLRRYAESDACYRLAYSCWLRLGEEYEANVVYTNMCNSLHRQGKDADALKMARTLYDRLDDSEQLLQVRAKLAGNMGLYAFHLKEYSTSEAYLTEAMDMAEKGDFESVFINAAMTFAKACEKTGGYMRGFKVMERLMDIMWRKGEYSIVLDALDKACEFLSYCNHIRQAHKLRQTWQERFSEIEGGKEMFEQRMNANAFDSREADRRREALAMAKSEGEPIGIANAYIGLAMAIHDDEPDNFRTYMYSAAEIFAECEDVEELTSTLVMLLSDCFSAGKADREYLEKILSYTTDSAICEVAELWLELGSWDAREIRKGQSERAYDDLLLKTLPYAKAYSALVLSCWSDLVLSIVQEASAKTILDMLRVLSDEDRETFEYLLENAFRRDMTENIDALKADYQGPQAVRMLAFYEKAVEVLLAIGSVNTGVLAGNIAIIFRRRKEQEKTLRYHKISMEDYLRQGIPYDALIEKLNLATAYREFGRLDEAITTLREALVEAQKEGIAGMVGSIAGNLAAILRDRGHAEDHDEIVACFALEESYFREQGMARDLAISLLNQSAYGLFRNDAASVMSKLSEGGRIVRENRFKEFFQALATLESMAAKQMNTASSEGNFSEEEARALFEELLAVNGQFKLGRIYFDDGNWNADCVLSEENENFFTKLRLLLLPQTDNEVIFGALFSPARYADAALENLNAYVEWCNTLPFYKMTVMENFEVQGVYRIRAANREELKDRFHFYLQLWTADCLAMAMLAVGMDLATCQGLKLTVLDMDGEDGEDGK